MPGIAEIALAGAPLAGGALLGLAAGNMKAPDVRGLIKQDMDLLDRLPVDQVERRANLQRVIDQRVDDLIIGADKAQSLREVAMSYRGNWRDIVVFVCALLFTIIWWNVSHNRANWLAMFLAMILLCVVTAAYAGRGIWQSVRSMVGGTGK
ncbi:MAG TPA: hypothetical protein PKI77_17740 [Mycobacterium sp.]|nr:hypothetical protein [Mycobacterium sp.]